LRRVEIGCVSQADLRDGVGGGREPCGARRPHQLQRQGHVLQGIAPGQQVGILKDIADPFAGVRQLCGLDRAAVGSVQAGENSQERGLAATRGTEDGEKFAVRDIEIEVVDCSHAGGEDAANTTQPDGDFRPDCRGGLGMHRRKRC
jgi:hypothetical protein